MRCHLEVLVRRGSIVESRHRVQVVVSDAAGDRLFGSEQDALATSFRSSAKPFQLLPLVERGHAERWGFDDRQLAIMAASHTGSPEHLALVRTVLERIGCSASDLACAYHDPTDPVSLEELRVQPALRSTLYNNCSGKHAGMLALCRSEGWPTRGYETAEHPLQQLMRRTVGEMCGLDTMALEVAIDGCGVWVFGLPLAHMALGYARFAAARSDGPAREGALARIRAAMAAHPRVIGGDGRFDSDLARVTGGRLVAKVGAEGLECVAITERGLGLAVKCEDGSARGTSPATLAVLEHLELLSSAERAELARLRRPLVTNAAGHVVGEVDVQLELLAPLV